MAAHVTVPVQGKSAGVVLAVVELAARSGKQVQVTWGAATDFYVDNRAKRCHALPRGKDTWAASAPSATAQTAAEAAQAIAAIAPDLHLLGRASDGTAATVTLWLVSAASDLASTDYARFSATVDRLNTHLRMRSFIAGYSLSLADLVVADALKSSSLWKTMVNKTKAGEDKIQHVQRWVAFVESQDVVKAAAAAVANQARIAKEEAVKPKDQGSFDINLQDAAEGTVVTRFPPEPSGYLHIGHAKAALLNEYFARRYKGKLIVRFDDTNPSKEKEEFEHAILEDLEMLRIKPDQVTWTSDSFDRILEYAEVMIRAGKAYVDETPVDQMRDERLKSIESKARSLSVEENLKRWEEMKAGTEFGKSCCLRAKIDMKSKNGAMRDPVMYRCNDVPHNRTGHKFKLYPTYDFACPIVDSLEGVTHALRTNEYHDRNDQFYWFIDTLGLRKPHIWDYSRINFVYTLLSKRKLTWFVENKRVTGWDDPRFPTIRGILRRGMTVEALKEYILMQGASRNVLLLEWDKIWAVNRRIIDPVAPRFTAIGADTKVLLTLAQGPASPYTAEVAKHKKNPDAGVKTVTFSSRVYLEAEDASELAADEEVTLMDWGNAIIRTITRDAEGRVTALAGDLHLAGDFKKTKKKLTWLSADAPHLPVILHDYGFLITKKKLEEEDTFQDCLAETTEFHSTALVDQHLSTIKKGDIIQLERRGFFICDANTPGETLSLIAIPDGKQAAAPAGPVPVKSK